LDRWLQVQWGKTEAVDLLCLVPAWKYDEGGLDPNFELPEDFRVLLVDEQGKTLKVIAEEHNTRSDPVRHGHPFCYRVDPPLRCSGRMDAQDDSATEFEFYERAGGAQIQVGTQGMPVVVLGSGDLRWRGPASS
jgi:hypothetical protein